MCSVSFFWIVSSVFPYTCIMSSSAPVQRVFFQYKNKTWKQSIIFWIISSCFFRDCRFCWGSTLLRDAVLTFRFPHSQHHAFHQFAWPSGQIVRGLVWGVWILWFHFWRFKRSLCTKNATKKKEKHHFLGVKRHVTEHGKKKLPPNVKLRQLFRWKPPIFRWALCSMNSFSNWKLCRYRGKEGRFNQNKLIAAHQMAFSPNQWISTSKSYQRQICRLKLARNTCDVHGKNLDKSSNLN